MADFLKIIYLDREFVSNLYESETGLSPTTEITKTEGAKASAALPLFSAGVTSAESKSYSISTVGMLHRLAARLSEFPMFNEENHGLGRSSAYCWVEGSLSLGRVTVKRHKTTATVIGESNPNSVERSEIIVADESYFSLRTESGDFALVSTPDYFFTGLATFIELAGSVVGKMEMPARALVRVYSAQTSFKQWVATPLVMVEP